MQENYLDIIKAIDEDPTRVGLKRTPARAAKAMEYMTQGYHLSLDDIINEAIFESDMSEMVLVNNIELYSLCEHHLLPFIGQCHIAYIPDGKIIGLSKIARVVNFFARRLQIQERLTHQIATCILDVTDCRGVGVVLEAKHLCMMMRGVEKQNSLMKTSSMLGAFREDARTRSEFLSLIK